MRTSPALLLILAGCAAASSSPGGKTMTSTAPPSSPTLLNPDPALLRRTCVEHLATAQRRLDAILAEKGTRTEANTLAPFNDIGIALDEALSLAGIMTNLNPDKTVREAAEASEQELQKFSTDLSLNRGLYEAIAAVDASRLDADGKRMVERTLRDFRRSGVDRDEPTRARIRKLNEDLVVTDQEFGRTIREDVRSVTVASAADLAGLPADYIASHKPGPDGRIRITTDYPDVFPVLSYADNDDLRRRISFEFNTRGFPANQPVLARLLKQRHELAGLLGYPSWAAFIIEDKMARSAAEVDRFIREIATIA